MKFLFCCSVSILFIFSTTVRGDLFVCLEGAVEPQAIQMHWGEGRQETITIRLLNTSQATRDFSCVATGLTLSEPTWVGTAGEVALFSASKIHFEFKSNSA